MLDDFKTELQKLGGMSMERAANEPSTQPPALKVEKSQDDHIEVADALTLPGRVGSTQPG